MTHPPIVVGEWLAFLIAAGGLLALVGAFYGVTIRPRLERVSQELRAVRFHLEPNGHEDEAHIDDRNLPVRTLLMRVARRQRESDGLIADLERRHQAHDLDHARRASQK